MGTYIIEGGFRFPLGVRHIGFVFAGIIGLVGLCFGWMGAFRVCRKTKWSALSGSISKSSARCYPGVTERV